MKTLIFILTLFVISNLLTINVKALEPPCDDPCPGNNWTYVQNVNCPPPPQCPSCTITYNYWWKYNNCTTPPTKEIVLGMISVQGDCEMCTIDWDFLFMWVYNHLLINNPFPRINNCVDLLRVSQPSCWHWVPGNGGTNPIGHYEYCTETGCCWNRFKICYNTTPPTITYLEGNNLYIECPFEGDSPCRFICNLIYQYYNPLPKIGINVDYNNSSLVNDFKVSVKSKSIQFTGTCENNLDLTLIISDVKGKEYINMLLNTQNKKIDNEIYLDKLNSGVYYYQIIDKSNIIRSGKFYFSK
jgi:hypothetical protein